MNEPDHKRTLLKSVFGHDSFRTLQEDSIDSILNRHDLLMILPTGGGKSLCYQLPSLLMKGVTVVISPLIALMHDQIKALEALGVSAGMISSTQNQNEVEKVYRQLVNRELKLVYVAPERFKGGRFITILQQIEINFFVIDEAHCVSEWGHEFREDYRHLDLLRRTFPDTGIAAFTATATEKVQKDIITNLKMRTPSIFRGPVFRDNMKISSTYRIQDGRNQLLSIIQNHPEENGIVYCFTRNATESLAQFLQKNGIKSSPYHAGLPAAVRNSTYHDFIHDEIHIVVATVAFGMGIDKSNIRFVVHMSLPKTIENYYQEIGRAGRDGLPANVYLLFSVSDLMQRKSLIDQLEDPVYKDHALGKLDAMIKYAESENCRHRILAGYFEDPHQKNMNGCKTLCDNCLDDHNPGVSPKESVDITINSRKFLSAVYRTEQRFGTNYIIDILRASKNQKIIENCHDTLSVYGIGKDLNKSQWHALAQRLQELGCLQRGEFQELKIMNSGFAILKKEITVEMRKERFISSTLTVSNKKQLTPIVTSENSYNFEKMKTLRALIAKKENVPAYIVFNDKTLIEMAEKIPLNRDEMLAIGGIGEKKYERYGNEFLNLCKEIAQK